MKKISFHSTIFNLGISLIMSSCSPTANQEAHKTIYANDLIPFFQHWNLILGDGSNAGQANNFEYGDFFCG